MQEEERWILHGLSQDDPECITCVEELERYIHEIGFLPLFRNEIPGFSVEEHTAAENWWTGDEAYDPWEWRKVIASGDDIAYGKFFDRKAGFISKEWFPVFANYRRDGYDFDARWDDELAGIRSKKIMDLFADDFSDRELYSFEIRQLAGFGGKGEKNFEGEITRLQMQTYLCVRDFRRRKSKKGDEYGWGIAVYCLPEHLWGYEYVTGAYSEDPKDSALKIVRRIREVFPDTDADQIRKILGVKEDGEQKKKKELPYPDNLVKALRIDGLQADTMSPDQKAGLTVALGQLRDRHQKTLYLKYEQHLKNEEIGRIMNRSAGTIGTYHTKAMGKLKWKSISRWYLEGYEQTMKNYLHEKGRDYQEIYRRKPGEAEAMDYCLRIGISIKQFESLYAGGIVTIWDLVLASSQPGWYRPIRGIGEKIASDIRDKLERQYINLLAEEKETQE